MKRTPVIAAAFLLATTALSSLTLAHAEGSSGGFSGGYDSPGSRDLSSLRELLGGNMQERGGFRERFDQRQDLRDLILGKLERRNQLRNLLADRMDGGDEGYDNEGYSNGGYGGSSRGGYGREGLRDRILDRIEQRQALRDLILDKLERRNQLSNLIRERLEGGDEGRGYGESSRCGGWSQGGYERDGLRDRIRDRIEQRQALRDLILDKLERRNQLRNLLSERLEGRGDELGESSSERADGGGGAGRDDLRDLILDRVRNNPQAGQVLNRLRDRIGGRG